ncbi:MAG: hypothetical protein ACW981_01570 [Candidatus Hodarchaeales archaeon]|jgi:hypothetical protein
MSLDKFLKKNKSNKKVDKESADKKVETTPNRTNDPELPLENSIIDKKTEFANISQNYINLPYNEFLEIIKQIPTYSDYLTQVIWIIEDGRMKEIEEFLIENYSLSKTFAQVVINEAKRIISEEKK